MLPKVGQKIERTDPCEGRLFGVVIELWPEQDMAVVENNDDPVLYANYFVPYDELREFEART